MIWHPWQLTILAMINLFAGMKNPYLLGIYYRGLQRLVDAEPDEFCRSPTWEKKELIVQLGREGLLLIPQDTEWFI